MSPSHVKRPHLWSAFRQVCRPSQATATDGVVWMSQILARRATYSTCMSQLLNSVSIRHAIFLPSHYMSIGEYRNDSHFHYISSHQTHSVEIIIAGAVSDEAVHGSWKSFVIMSLFINILSLTHHNVIRDHLRSPQQFFVDDFRSYWDRDTKWISMCLFNQE